MLESSNGPLTQVAAELGVQPSVLRAWRAAIPGTVMPSRAVAPRTGTVGPRAASLADLASQIAKLKREFDRTRMACDVQKSHRHLRGGAEMRFSFIEQHGYT
ncbi:MAG TPA: transposase [Geminicoccus sp.]|uniref:transposase n=1 Tax=Geminicoccus sp. TaxID=2024832 RepID=UPI002E31AF53|nr:transposase [Geminicoccus sp.]HEX2526646.1 transposase [Geminicoccus sp.]